MTTSFIKTDQWLKETLHSTQCTARSNIMYVWVNGVV